jgi:hypothetical protein
VDEPFVPGSREFEERFFRDDAVVTLQIGVLQEMLDALSALARRQGIELDEAVRSVLARGLACRRADDYLAASEEEQARIARELFSLESNLAVMRYSTFAFMRDNQTLEMQNAAVKNANEGLKAAVDRLHAQEDELLDRLRALQDELEAVLPEPSCHRTDERTPERRRGILERLEHWLGITRGSGR